MRTFLSLILISGIWLTAKSQEQIYKNLVFEGAGIKGIAYSGVIRELENAGRLEDIDHVGGTSAGAITALLVSLDYSADEIYRIISDTDFQKFNDIGSRLNKKYGLFRGDKFSEWIGQLIERKTGDADITFRELVDQGYRKLYVTATSLNKQKLIILSHETYPQMKIRDAVRISMSIPLYFEAVFVDSTGQVYDKPRKHNNLDIMVDGGIIGNYPIFIFDSLAVENGQTVRIPDKATLGVRMDTESQIERDAKDRELVPVQIDNITGYVEAFYTLIIENLNRNSLTRADWERTISVSSAGIGPRIKKLSEAQKNALIESGETYTRKFLENR